jgi:preprotein translocase subunit SecF
VVLSKVKAWAARQYDVIEGNLKFFLILALPAMLIGVASVWHKLHGLELVGTISAIASGWVIAGWIVYANRATHKLTATR